MSATRPKVKSAKEGKAEAARVAAEYRAIGMRLDALHSSGSGVISRYDNNQVFELARWFRAVADRIKRGYPESDYRTAKGDLAEEVAALRLRVAGDSPPPSGCRGERRLALEGVADLILRGAVRLENRAVTLGRDRQEEALRLLATRGGFLCLEAEVRALAAEAPSTGPGVES